MALTIGGTASEPLPTDGQASWGEGALNDVLTEIRNAIEAGATQAGISITGPLAFDGNPTTDMSAVRFRNSTNPGIRSIYFVSNELWVTDGSGNALQLTTNGAINVSSVASITGLAGSNGSAAYSTPKFTWLAASEGAQMEFGTARLRKTGTSTVTILAASSDLGSDMTVTFPSGTIAAGTGLMTMTSAGAVGVTKDPSVNNIQANGTGTFNGQTTVNGQLVATANANLSGTTRFSGTVYSGPQARFVDVLMTGSFIMSGTHAHTLRFKQYSPNTNYVVQGSFSVSQTVLGAFPAVTTPAAFLMGLDGLEDGDRIRYFGYTYQKPDTTDVSLTCSLGKVYRDGTVGLVKSLPATQGSTGSLLLATALTGNVLARTSIFNQDAVQYFVRVEMTGSVSNKVFSITLGVDRPE